LGSREVIGHVTIRLPGVEFLWVIHSDHASIWYRYGDIAPHGQGQCWPMANALLGPMENAAQRPMLPNCQRPIGSSKHSISVGTISPLNLTKLPLLNTKGIGTKCTCPILNIFIRFGDIRCRILMSSEIGPNFAILAPIFFWGGVPLSRNFGPAL